MGRSKKEKEPKICPICGKEYNSPWKTCSKECGHRASGLKLAEKAKSEREKKLHSCLQCGKLIEPWKKFCSRSCATTYNNLKRGKGTIHWSEEKRKAFSERQFYAFYGETKEAVLALREQERKEKIPVDARKYQTPKREIPNHTYKKYTCKHCGKLFTVKTEGQVRGVYCSRKCQVDHLQFLKEHAGGYREGSGRGKSGWYRNIPCDSTWELAFLIYHLDNNLPIKRCCESRKYVFEGKEHTYCPDFITNQGVIEIKGYSSPQWKAKQEQNKDVIIVEGKKGIKPYLDYIEQKYGLKGNDLVKLYDYRNKKDKPIQLSRGV